MDKTAFVMGVFSLLLAACTTTPGKRIPREAANAMMGSAETLTAISALDIEGNGPGIASFKREMNLRRGRFREEETRASQRKISGFDGKSAYRIDADGNALTLSEKEARMVRAEMYHHPVAFLLAVFSRDIPAGNSRVEGNSEAVDITVNRTIYTMYIDASTKLPSRIVSFIKDDGGATVMMETLFDRYVNVHGYKLPSLITRKIDAQVISEIHINLQYAGAATAEGES